MQKPYFDQHSLSLTFRRLAPWRSESPIARLTPRPSASAQEPALSAIPTTPVSLNTAASRGLSRQILVPGVHQPVTMTSARNLCHAIITLGIGRPTALGPIIATRMESYRLTLGLIASPALPRPAMVPVEGDVLIR